MHVFLVQWKKWDHVKDVYVLNNLELWKNVYENEAVSKFILEADKLGELGYRGVK